MTDIEKKALALVNEVNGRNWVYLDEPYGDELREALCRAIEAHEADNARNEQRLADQARLSVMR